MQTRQLGLETAGLCVFPFAISEVNCRSMNLNTDIVACPLAATVTYLFVVVVVDC